MDIKILLALPVLLFVLVFIINSDWKNLVKLVLFIIIFDGALRKWVLPQASNLIYLFKDFFLFFAYIKYFFFSRKQPALETTTSVGIAYIFLFISTLWLIFQSFNPDLGTPVAGIFGLTRYLLYVPLMWLVPYLFNSQEEFDKFLRIYLLTLIPVCLLGVAQFFSPPSSFLNIAPGGEEASELLGFGADKIRISGTFSFPNLYTTYLTVCFGFVIYFIFNEQNRFWRIATFAELLLMIANFFMTGARGIILFSVLILVGYLGLKSLEQLQTIIKFFQKMTIPAIIIAILLARWFAPALEAFGTRTTSTSSSEFSHRILYAFEIAHVPNKTFFDGYGTGATQAGGIAIQRALQLPDGVPTPPAESEINRITIEIGLVGTIFWYGMRAALLISLWFVYRRLKNQSLKDLALIAFLINLQFLPNQVVVHPVAVVYYWFLNSFILLLPRLEKLSYYQQQSVIRQKYLI